jgi:N6-L-threonylcarbamoyladenine synthase
LFPAIALIVSGGHTQLVLMKGLGKYKIIGETRDDAAGECYDKTARVLGLPYPGGPAISAEAKKLPTTNYQLPTKLPRPMIYSKDYDFSFSGLKTAVLYDFKKRSRKVQKSEKYIQEMSAEIQQAINDVLIKKTIKAAKDFSAKTIILGGGVAANDELRKQFNYKLQTTNYKLNFLAPPKIFCTDNALMIAVTAYFQLKRANWKIARFKNWQKIKADANLRIS